MRKSIYLLTTTPTRHTHLLLTTPIKYPQTIVSIRSIPSVLSNHMFFPRAALTNAHSSIPASLNCCILVDIKYIKYTVGRVLIARFF